MIKVLNFNYLQTVEKSWGYEEIIENNSWYCGKRLTIFEGNECSFHYHIKKIETFWVVEGAIKLWVENSLPTLLVENTGKTITIMNGIAHKFCGLLPVNRFIEFSTTHHDIDSIRLELNKDYVIEEGGVYRRT